MLNIYYDIRKEVRLMKTVRMLVTLPKSLKAKLDALRSQGYTASGYIRALLERELMKNQVTRKREATWKAK